METVNEIQLSYTKSPIFCYQIKSSLDSDKCFREIYAHEHKSIELKEYMYALFLNRANEVVHYYRLSEGGISGTVADLRLVFASALKCLASGIIVAHNHPSGSLQASDADLTLTQQLVDAGKLLDISVLDHVILTKDSYTSLADQGYV